MKAQNIMEIAKLAGVSKSTVSRVISRPEMVNKETLNKVLSIIEKEGFKPNQLAQNLAGSASKIVGIVVDEIFNPYFLEVIESAEKIFSKEGYGLQMYSSGWDEKAEYNYVTTLLARKVDGIILSPIKENAESVKALKMSNIPYILLNNNDSSNSISTNDKKGGEIVADFINQLEKDQIIVATGFKHQSILDRISGFNSHINQSCPILRYGNINTIEEGEAFSRQLLENRILDNKKTIMFITNDNVAIAVSSILIDDKISIGEDVKIIGYDNIRIASLFRVPLTTVSQDIKKQGILAANYLISMIRDSKMKIQSYTTEAQLIIRDSCK